MYAIAHNVTLPINVRYNAQSRKDTISVAKNDESETSKLCAEGAGHFKDADFVRHHTGYAIGGVPAIGHTQPIELAFFDQDLCKWKKVWSAAGTPHSVYEIDQKALTHLSGAKIIPVT